MKGGLALPPKAKPSLGMLQVLVRLGGAGIEEGSDQTLDSGWAIAHAPGTELSDKTHYTLESGWTCTGSQVSLKTNNC